MRRRDFIILLAGEMGGWSSDMRAQQKTMPVIGFLGVTSPGSFAPFMTALHHGLSETGYVEGQNVAIEYRWAEDRQNRLAGLATDLVARKVDVIVTSGGTPPARAASDATSTIPIYFIGVGNPVATGLVASLARPGGNVTGVSNMAVALIPKRVEILSELVPQARMIALLMNPNAPNTEPM